VSGERRSGPPSAETRSPRATSRRTVVVLVLAAACWGLGTVISKRATDEIPPLTLLPIQLGVSLIVLGLLMRWRGLPFRDPTASPILARLGVLNPGIAYALSLLGLVHITASLSVVLWVLEPLLILGLAAFFLRERVEPLVLGLSLVALAGILLVVYQPGGGSPLGVALTVAGVVCCAAYTVITRRWLASADSTAQVVLAQEAYALGFSLIVLAAIGLTGGSVWQAGLTPAGWASAVASGVLYYALAYWFYLTALREVAAPIAAMSFYLIPVFGVAGGFLLLGERLEPGQWIGVAIVLGAIALIFRRTSAAQPVLDLLVT
jgi:probable blue pigment (indigoidine) exporter